jgi:hypothetical protein
VAAFAWPIAVVVLGVVFMFVFRTQIGRFLDRTKSVGKDGVKAYDETKQLSAPKPDALTQFLETYHNPLLIETEAAIEEDEKKRGLTNPSDTVKALRKSLAGVLIVWQFERTYNIIWRSQVSALIFLNGRAPELTPEAEIQSFFDAAASDYPTLYEGREFKDWLGYLTSQLLVLRTADGVAITVRGREFLKWRIEEGRNGPYHG